MTVQEKGLLFVLGLLQVLLIWYFDDAILFWDTVQFAGKQASFFYENGLQNGLVVPQLIDSGHPPFFPLYISFMWDLFGRSLGVSHWSMVPFLLGIIYQAIRLGHLLTPKIYWLFPILLFVCPFYLGHSILVSPDIVLLLGFLLAIRGVLMGNRWHLMVGILLMCLISNRGVAMSFGIFLYQFYTINFRGWKETATSVLKQLPPYLPGVLLFLGYSIFHLLSTGWIGYSELSSWAPSFELISLCNYPRNFALFAWKLLDYGMVAAALIVLYQFRFLFIMRGRLIWLLLFVIGILAVLIIPYKGLLNHRYFLPAIVVMLLLTAQILNGMNRKGLTIGVILFIFLGNFWIYPDSISQGWDATWAHTPFYDLEEKMKNSLERNGIKMEEVGTAFPIRTPRKFLNLNQEELGYHKYNLSTDKYVLSSNVMNDFTDEELEELQQNWDVLHVESCCRIKLVLYQNPKLKE